MDGSSSLPQEATACQARAPHGTLSVTSLKQPTPFCVRPNIATRLDKIDISQSIKKKNVCGLSASHIQFSPSNVDHTSARHRSPSQFSLPRAHPVAKYVEPFIMKETTNSTIVLAQKQSNWNRILPAYPPIRKRVGIEGMPIEGAGMWWTVVLWAYLGLQGAAVVIWFHSISHAVLLVLRNNCSEKWRLMGWD